MSALFQQMPELQIVFNLFIVIVIALYVLSIIWVVKDARARGALWVVWGIVSLIPLVGVLAYNLMRPPLLQSDRDEQELDVTLKRRELMKYGECASCGYPVEVDYVMCPNCHQRLKNLCPTCHHALEPEWSICPYCTTQIGKPRRNPAQRNAMQDGVRTRSSQRSQSSLSVSDTTTMQQGATLWGPACSAWLHVGESIESIMLVPEAAFWRLCFQE